MNHVTRLSIVLVLLISSSLQVHAAELTQRDWMVTLVDVLGWSYGLPDEPQDPDYINILTGNRRFRFEAEDIYSEDEDNVSVVTFDNFGSFSGTGWLNGDRNATTVHLRFTLPSPGDYLVQAHLRRAGHQFAFGDTTITADAEDNFTLVTIGQVQMQEGPQEILLKLAPAGAIDYITLTAPNLETISPGQGWHPGAPLTWENIQTTLLQLFHLAELLPIIPTPLVYEAEAVTQSKAKVVTTPHLGSPSGGKWLNAGVYPEEVRFPINLPGTGFYDLTLRVTGDPIRIAVGNHQELQLAAKPYLENYTFNALFLPAGDSNITVILPPSGGIDQIILTPRQTDSSLASMLLDLDASGEPNSEDLDTITSMLAAFGVTR